MKKSDSIFFVVLATLILFTLSIFPHHHHEGIPCISLESCERHHEDTDQEHDHEPTESRASHRGPCCSVDIIKQHNAPKIPVDGSFLVAVPLNEPPQTTFSSLKKEQTLSFLYFSADVSHLNGLRAPPCLIS